MFLSLNTKKILLALLLLIAISFGSLLTLKTTSSQSSNELLDQIEEQKKKLQETEENITGLEKDLENTQNYLKTAADGLPKLEAQIKEVELSLSINKEILQYVEDQKILHETEKEHLEQNQEASVVKIYKNWKFQSESPQLSFYTAENTQFSYYDNAVLGVGNNAVEAFRLKIDQISIDLSEFSSIVTSLEKQNAELLAKKKQIEQEIAYYNSFIASGSAQKLSLIDQQSSIQKNIGQLKAEQQSAAEYEAWILQQQNQRGGDNTPDDPIENGFILSGSGRDLYQGHGVGFSQFGAYGGANSGMSYQELIKFYFTGVTITQASGSVSVIGGPQNINVEDYLVHLGEVPDKACGSSAQVESNPAKYALNTSLWSCWPEDAIKAQVVIARTYALYHRNLYPDARSQVYNTSYNKKWAQEETTGQVIKYGGQFIDAVYSSDNSQGFGTANNDTIFQDFFGNGTPYAYLRGVNDSSFARKTSWTNWTYSTKAYNTASVLDMINHNANNAASKYSTGVKNNLRNIMSELGEISSISFERDPSRRIKKVWLTGTNGNKKSIGGWWFKNMWNSWAYDTGTYDYLYSQTFYLIEQD